MSKILEMWACDDFTHRLNNDVIGEINRKKSDYFKNKVTITIHEERKVTISELEFDDLFPLASKDIKEKLFNKQD